MKKSQAFTLTKRSMVHFIGASGNATQHKGTETSNKTKDHIHKKDKLTKGFGVNLAKTPWIYCMTHGQQHYCIFFYVFVFFLA